MSHWIAGNLIQVWLQAISRVTTHKGGGWIAIMILLILFSRYFNSVNISLSFGVITFKNLPPKIHYCQENQYRKNDNYDDQLYQRKT